MAETKSARFDVQEDRPFQEKFWSFQRFAWAMLLLIVIAALAGLTGQGGPFAHASISSSTGSLDYPNVTRWEASDDLLLTLPAGASNQAEVEIGSTFSDIFEVEDIQPAPSESQATATGQRLTFDLGDAGGEKQIVMNVRAMKPSLGRPMTMQIDNGPVMTFRPVVLP